MAETSVDSSRPTELYRFTGSFRNYFYTSADRVLELPTGEDGALEKYNPIPLTRSRIKVGTQEDDNLTLNLDFPFDAEVVLDYAFATTPPKLELELYRQQAGDPDSYAVFWKGSIRGFNIDGRIAQVQVPSIFSAALQSEVPNVYYQSPCNHVLYDSNCKVDSATALFNGVVGGVNGLLITTTASAGADGDFIAGTIINLRNFEERMILANNGNQINIGFPFADIRPGDPVRLLKGCDHSLATCKAKFNNVVNFGGFPYIPQDNPFEGTL